MNKKLDKYFFMSKESKSVYQVIDMLQKDSCTPFEIIEVLTRIIGLSLPEARDEIRKYTEKNTDV